MISLATAAVMIEALGKSLEDDLAAGRPAKWLVLQAIAGCYYIARECRDPGIREG